MAETKTIAGESNEVIATIGMGLFRTPGGIAVNEETNRVLSAQLAPDDIDARIEATLTHFRSRRLPMSWRIGPSSQPADLGKHLMAHGLTYTGDTTGS